jgi:hypothetical protein
VVGAPPTIAECGDYMHGKLALFVEQMNVATVVGGGLHPPYDDCHPYCTPSEALEFYAPIRNWTFSARRLTSVSDHCN